MELKTGQSLRFLSPYVQLDVEAGVLQAIRWLKPGESVMPDCRLERPGESVE